MRLPRLPTVFRFTPGALSTLIDAAAVYRALAERILAERIDAERIDKAGRLPFDQDRSESPHDAGRRTVPFESDQPAGAGRPARHPLDHERRSAA